MLRANNVTIIVVSPATASASLINMHNSMVGTDGFVFYSNDNAHLSTVVMESVADAVCGVAAGTRSPTGSPSSSPTASDPTSSPTSLPTSSGPTASPTSSPSTSEPTTSPSAAAPTCADEVDIGFLVGRSYSTTSSEFADAMTFSAEVARHHDMDKTKFTIASFADGATGHLSLDSNPSSYPALRAAFEGVAYSADAIWGNELSEGLAMASSTAAANWESSTGRPRVLIVITDDAPWSATSLIRSGSIARGTGGNRAR